MDPPIQSTSNPLVRRFRGVASGAQPELVIAEGHRLVNEALAAGQGIVAVAWSPQLQARPGGEALLARLQTAADEVHACTDRVLQRLSLLKTHQGVSVILRRPASTFADLLGAPGGSPLIVVAAGVQDPGNLGALVRSAEAAGATGLLALAGSADLYREKALRGSSGSAFRLPCVTHVTVDEAIEQLRAHAVQILVADRSAGRSCWDVDLRGPTALVLGAEGGGVPEPLQRAAAGSVGIPLAPSVESLNVAVAAGVLLFEARRQRR